MNGQIFVPTANLLVNGNFIARDPEQRPLDWVLGKGLQTATISATEKHGTRADDQSLRMADTSNSLSVLVRSKKVIAAPGTFYQAGAWAKRGGGRPGSFSIEFWDQNNALIRSERATLSHGDGWQVVNIRLEAPDRCTHVTVSIATGIAETGISYWDDVSLVRETSYGSMLTKGVHELFLDDERLEQMVDVERILHPAKKSKIIIAPTAPWEATSSYIYGTVLYDEPKGSGYRMWYTSYLKGHYYLCYATSRDGISWTKPNLGISEFNGSSDNNICREGGGTLVYDPTDTDPAKRYKLMAFDGSKELFGYNVYFSPDGLHWTHGHPKPVLPYGDVSNVAFDRDKGLFIATTKQRMLVSNTSVTSGKNDRMAFLSVSKDFINWTAPAATNSPYVLAVEGDERDDLAVRARGGIESNVYGMPVYPYEGVYIGLPWMFDINSYGTGEFAVTGDGRIQPQLAVSRDLRHWSRPLRDPIIPLGKAGAWDDGTLYTSSTMQVSDREMSIYYGAMNLPHGGSTSTQVQSARISRATWRRDGMVSLSNAGDDGGTVTTKPIQVNGGRLKVNAKLNKDGSLTAELLDETGKTIPGFGPAQSKVVKGDQLRAEVEWKGSPKLQQWAGKLIRIRFYLKGGDLFSYWFE